MKYSPKQITMDLEEYNLLNGQLEAFRRKPEDGSLSADEQQEATGILLARALQNPGLFRSELGEVDLGKYKVIFVRAVTQEDYVRVKFVRT